MMKERKWNDMRLVTTEEGKTKIADRLYYEVNEFGRKYLLAFYQYGDYSITKVDVYRQDGIWLTNLDVEERKKEYTLLSSSEKKHLILKNSLFFTYKDIKPIRIHDTIYYSHLDGKLLGFILLDNNGSIIIMNDKGEVNEVPIRESTNKLKFEKKASKIFLKCAMSVYVFMLYDKNGACNFANVKITKLPYYYCVEHFKDCPYTQFIKIKNNNEWKVYDIVQEKILDKELSFEPEVEVTETEIRLYTQIDLGKLYIKVYNKEYKCILKTCAMILETIYPDTWFGKSPFTYNNYLIKDGLKPLLIKQILDKDYERQGDFILDKEHNMLYYIGCYYDGMYSFELEKSINKDLKFIAGKKYAIIYYKKAKRFYLYSPNACMLRNKWCWQDLSDISIDEIHFSFKYVFLPNGRKYRRSKLK